MDRELEDAPRERPRARVRRLEGGLGPARGGEDPVPHERAFLGMRALVHMDQIVVAREAAARFFERYPQSPYARLVFRLTGMRPLPPIGR